jgi:putative protease
MEDELITIEGEKIGSISHYFGQIGVAVIDLTGNLKVGDKIRIKGSTTDFEQEVNSMQIDKEQVNEAGNGQSIGLKVGEKVRVGDEVFKL